MKNTRPAPPPSVSRALAKLGSDINAARRRRRISVKMMAERAAISRTTLSKIERGDPSVHVGHYATVIFILGFHAQLADLVDIRNDNTGLAFEDETLPKRIRPKKARNVSHDKMTPKADTHPREN
jgi:DNA-binding XRE family transcriptional regulator